MRISRETLNKVKIICECFYHVEVHIVPESIWSVRWWLVEKKLNLLFLFRKQIDSYYFFSFSDMWKQWDMKQFSVQSSQIEHWERVPGLWPLTCVGELEVVLDRRLQQDDNRGLGQGVTDNKLTAGLYHLLLEDRRGGVQVRGRYPGPDWDRSVLLMKYSDRASGC